MNIKIWEVRHHVNCTLWAPGAPQCWFSSSTVAGFVNMLLSWRLFVAGFVNTLLSWHLFVAGFVNSLLSWCLFVEVLWTRCCHGACLLQVLWTRCCHGACFLQVLWTRCCHGACLLQVLWTRCCHGTCLLRFCEHAAVMAPVCPPGAPHLPGVPGPPCHHDTLLLRQATGHVHHRSRGGNGKLSSVLVNIWLFVFHSFICIIRCFTQYNFLCKCNFLGFLLFYMTIFVIVDN